MQLAVTGHRPQKLGKGFNDHVTHQRIKDELTARIAELDPEVLISGMALGIDQWAVEFAIKERIPFIAAVPFKHQDDKWSSQIRQHYQWLLSKAHQVVYVDRIPGFISDKTLPDLYHPAKMMKRNEWIVRKLHTGDTLLGVCEDTNSGTWHTLATANGYNKAINIEVLKPSTFKWISYEKFLDDELPF